MLARKRKKKSAKQSQSKTLPSSDKGRNLAFDTLRGLAIVMMIIDHVAAVAFEQNIELGQIRFFTRLSMPLFCVLTGYLVAGKTNVNWRRLLQVLLAAVVVNSLYVPYYGRFEILVSLLLSYLLFAAIGDWTMVFAGGALFYAFDPTAPGPSQWLWNGQENLLDYPFSVVVTPFAIGIAFKKLSGWQAYLALTLLMPAFWLVPAPSVYVLWFVPLAVLLLKAADANPKLVVRPLAWVGKFPLQVYVVQYVLILGAAMVISAFQAVD